MCSSARDRLEGHFYVSTLKIRQRSKIDLAWNCPNGFWLQDCVTREAVEIVASLLPSNEVKGFRHSHLPSQSGINYCALGTMQVRSPHVRKFVLLFSPSSTAPRTTLTHACHSQPQIKLVHCYVLSSEYCAVESTEQGRTDKWFLLAKWQV